MLPELARAPSTRRLAIDVTSKGATKSSVAVLHTLSDKATAAKMKIWWGERLDALAAILDTSP